MGRWLDGKRPCAVRLRPIVACLLSVCRPLYPLHWAVDEDIGTRPLPRVSSHFERGIRPPARFGREHGFVRSTAPATAPSLFEVLVTHLLSTDGQGLTFALRGSSLLLTKRLWTLFVYSPVHIGRRALPPFLPVACEGTNGLCCLL